jgi:hypothetical protein
MTISDEAKRKIDRWIEQSGRNQFGDPKSTVYAGGNPLFSERSGTLLDRYEYILGRHPELKTLLEESR